MPDTLPDEGLPEQATEKPSARYPTRELGRLISAYKKIKDFGKRVPEGTMRNIQRCLDEGIELQDIVQAMENYEQARKNEDPQFTLGVRAFFTPEKVEYWLNPPAKTTFRPKPALPEISFTPLERPKPAQPITQQTLGLDEEDFTL